MTSGRDGSLAGPASLGGGSQAHIGFLIRRAQQRHVAMWSRLVSGETSSVQYSILAVLDALGSASQRQLCDEVDLDRSTIADLLARMQRRGLVERHRDPIDARRKVVTLTAHGRSERVRLHPLVEEVQRLLVEGMPEADRRALHHGLHQLLRHPTAPAGTSGRDD